MATTKRTPSCLSGVSPLARRRAAAAAAASAPSLWGPPLPSQRASALGPLRPPSLPSLPYEGVSYALAATPQVAAIPPPPPLPRGPLWLSVALAPRAVLTHRRAFIGPRSLGWYQHRGLVERPPRPVRPYKPSPSLKNLARPSAWRSYLLKRRPTLAPHVPVRLQRLDFPAVAPLDGPMRIVSLWARPAAGIAHFARLVQRVAKHHGPSWAQRFQEDPQEAWHAYRAAREEALAAKPRSPTRPLQRSPRQVKTKASIPTPASQCGSFAAWEELPARRRFTSPRSHFPHRTIAAFKAATAVSVPAMVPISPEKAILPVAPSAHKGTAVRPQTGKVQRVRVVQQTRKGLAEKLPSGKWRPVRLQWQTDTAPAQSGLARDVGVVEQDAPSQSVVVAPTPESVAMPASPSYSPHILADCVSSLPSVKVPDDDMWILVETLTWSTAKDQGQILHNKDYPHCLTTSHKTHPAMLGFYKSFQWRGDLRFKFVITSGVFQQGELLCAFLHELTTRRDRDVFLHSHSLSQVPHVILSAGNTSTVELHVPYVNSRPMLPIIGTSRSPPLNLGRLVVLVNNQLKAPEAVSQQAYIQLYVSFENSEFSGVGVIAQPAPVAAEWNVDIAEAKTQVLVYEGLIGDMIAGGFRGAIRSATNYFGLSDRNRDFPNVHAPPQPCVNLVSESLAIGQGISTARSLRLIPDSLAPHIVDSDELSIKSLAMKFGRVQVIKWQSEAVGTTLWYKPSSFLWPLEEYDVLRGEGGRPDKYFVPPMGVVASCFELARGTIEIKVRAVATSLHCGKLILGYVPYRNTPSKDISNTYLLGSSHMVWDISETSEITFQVPFVRNELWTPQVYVGSGCSDQIYNADGVIAINILTPLQVSSPTVVSSVDLNVFIRAGPDFEVAIPRPPVLYDMTYLVYQGPESDTGELVTTAHLPSENVARLTHGEAVVDFKDIFRRFSMLADFDISAVADETTSGTPCAVSIPLHFLGMLAQGTYDEWTRNRVLNSILRTIGPSFRYRLGGMRLKLVFSGITAETPIYVQHIPLVLKKKKNVVVHGALPVSTEVCFFLNSSFGVHFQRLDLNPVIDLELPCYNTNQYCLQALHPMSRQQEGINSDLGELRLFFPQRGAASNLKCQVFFAWADDTRMYCFQGFPAMASMSSVWTKPKPSARNPIKRHLNSTLDVQADQPSASSVVIPSLQETTQVNEPKPSVSIQESSSDASSTHRGIESFSLDPTSVRPASQVRPLVITLDYSSNSQAIMTAKAMWRRTTPFNYPVVIDNWDLHVQLNRQVIPQLPESSLEYLHLFFIHSQRVGYVNILDLSLYNTQAIYCELDGPKYKNYTIREWLETDFSDGGKQRHRFESADVEYQTLSDLATTAATMAAGVVGTGAAWAASSFVPNTPAAQVKSHVSTLQSLTTEVASMKSQVEAEMSSMRELMAIFTQYLAPIKGGRVNLQRALLSFIQLISSHSGTAFGINFVALLIDLDIIPEGLASWASVCVATVLGALYDSVLGSSQPLTESRIEYQGFLSKSEEYVNIVINLLCKCMNVIPNWSTVPVEKFSAVFVKLANTARGLNNIQTFIRANFELLDMCWKWIIGKVYKCIGLHWVLKDSRGTLRQWIEEAYVLTDPFNREKCMTNPQWSYRVHVADLNAQRLVIQSAGTTLMSSSLMVQLLSKVRALKADLGKSVETPPVRMEPFVVQIVGTTSVGKSSIADELIYTLLRTIYKELPDNAIYTREPLTEFWDGMPSQPLAIKSDDFLCVTGDQLGLQQIATLFSLKSCAVFMPPFADLKEKGRRINPDLYFLLSNTAYPSLAGVTCVQAVWRRRDVLLEMKLEGFTTVKDAVQSIKLMNPQADDENVRMSIQGLMRFRFRDPMNPEAPTDEWMQYDMVRLQLVRRFLEYRQMEQIAFTRRLKLAFNIEDSSSIIVNTFPLPGEDREKILDTVKGYKQILTELLASVPSVSEAALKSKAKLEALQKLSEMCSPEMAMTALNAIGGMDVIAPDSDLLSSVTGGAHLPLLPEPLCSFEQPQSSSTTASSSAPSEPMSQIEIDGVSEFLSSIEFQNEILEIPASRTPPPSASLVMPSAYKSELNYYGPVEPAEKALLDGVSVDGCYHHYLNNSAIYSNGRFVICNEETALKVLQVSEFQCHKCWGMENSNFLLFYTEWKRHNRTFIDAMLQQGLDQYVPAYCRPVIHDICRTTRLMEELRRSNVQDVGRTVPSRSIGLGKLFGGLLALSTAVFCGSLAWRFLGKFFKFPKEEAGALCSKVQHKISYPSESRAIVHVEDDSDSDDPSGFRTVSLLPQVIVASGDQVRAKKLTTKVRSLRVLNRPAPRESQTEFQSSTLLNAEVRVAKNTLFINVRDGDNRVRLAARCVGLVDRWILTTWHFVEQVKHFPPSDFFYEGVMNGVTIPLVTDFSGAVPYGPLALLELPRSVPCFKKILNLFATSQEHCRTSAASSVLIEVLQDQSLVNIWNDINARPLEQMVEIEAQAGASESVVHTGYQYVVGQAGMCGALLWDPMVENGKILGMHVAGAKGGRMPSSFGMAALTVREELEGLISLSSTHVTVAQPETYVPFVDREPTVVIDCNVEFVGSLPNELIPQNPVKTTIEPSRVAPYLPPPLTTPAPFLANDSRFKEPRNPFVEGVEKHGGIPRSWRQDMVERAYEFLLERFLRCKPVVKLSGKLSLQEAVCGIVGIDEIGQLDMTTSPGFGWKRFQPQGEKGKRWLFDLEETPNGNVLKWTDERLLDKLSKDNHMRESGVVPPTIFTDCLKDARIKIEKVQKKGCTRIFSLSPVEHTIACRQYTLEFVAAVMRNRIRNNICVGINMDSIEASRLVHKHKRMGTAHLTGDYSAFGDTLDPVLVWYVFKIIVEWYKYYGDASIEHELARWALGAETGQALHAARDLVYKVYAGLPSGSPLTVIINSMVNSFYMVLSFEEITGLPLEQFDQYVAEDNYGDDVWLTVAPELKEKFNNVSLHENFKKHDIKFTDALKTGEIRPWCKLEEVSFLKRMFIPHPYRPETYLAPLDWTSVEECAKWVHVCDDAVEATVVNLLQAQRLAYGHGPVKFDTFTRELKQAARSANLPPIAFLTWQFIDTQCFEE